MSLLAALAALSASPAAHAQSDADKENAQALYKAGNDARDAGDMNTAAAKYKVAYALAQTPVIAVALGKAEMATGQLIEARQTFLGVDRLPVKPHESALTTAARADASKLAAQIEGKIPTISLKIQRPSPSAAAPAVTIDGVTIPELALDVPRKVDPGAHTIVATVGSDKSEVPFQIAEGETRDVPVPYPGTAAPAAAVAVAATPGTFAPTKILSDPRQFLYRGVWPIVPPPPPPAAPPVAVAAAPSEPGAPAAVAVAPAAPPPAAPPSDSSHPSRAPGFIVLGVGIAGGVVTGVFGGLALSNKSTLSGVCGSGGNDCPPSAQSTVSSLTTNGIIADVGLGVAVVGVTVGTILLILESKSSSSSAALAPPAAPGKKQLEPWLALGAGGLSGTF